jgi:hypothetical protein
MPFFLGEEKESQTDCAHAILQMVNIETASSPFLWPVLILPDKNIEDICSPPN